MLSTALVVAACALVQSVFGIGLLVLGTPLLLLSGLPFTACVFYLLPCSILISALQLRDAPPETRAPWGAYLRCLAPAAAAGASCVFLLGTRLDIKPLVGWMLLLTGALRLSARARLRLGDFLKARLPAALVLVGAVHGLTNMGGGLLAILNSSIEREKAPVRSGIAAGYLIMALLQFGLLLALVGVAGDPRLLAGLLALSAAAYALLGRRVFEAASQPVFQTAMTGLLCLMGGVLTL